MRRFILFLSALLYGVGFFWLTRYCYGESPTPVQARVAGVSTEQTRTPLQSDVLARINSERKSRGLGPLFVEANAQLVAQARADDMSNRQYYAHRDPDGRLFVDYPFADEVKNADFSCENLVLLTTISPEQVVTEWLNSERGHRECLLHPNIVSVGVAQATIAPLASQDAMSYVTVFIARTAN